MPFNKEKIKGIDVAICDDSATLEDFICALDDYILCGNIDRIRSSTQQCEGCSICCQERIPLTSIDVFTLKKALHHDLELHDFLNKYAYIIVSERAVDISLAQDMYERCQFLNNETGRCQLYLHRPFVCHTYICTELSPRAKQLRDTIVNTGEDELVRLWLKEGKNNGLVIHEAYNPCVLKDDWVSSPWTEKYYYHEILIKDIVPAKLWTKLREGEKSV